MLKSCDIVPEPFSDPVTLIASRPLSVPEPVYVFVTAKAGA